LFFLLKQPSKNDLLSYSVGLTSEMIMDGICFELPIVLCAGIASSTHAIGKQAIGKSQVHVLAKTCYQSTDSSIGA
jgi:hypothetical protein